MHSNHAIGYSDGDTTALAEIVADVEKIKTELAALEAAQVRALARAADLAEKQAAGSSARVRDRDMALRSIAAELAGILRLTDRSVQHQIGEAQRLVTDYPATLDAWAAGRITRSHVHVVTDLGLTLPRDARPRFEQVALDHCQRETPGRARAQLRIVAERLHPRTMGERHREARETRAVRVFPLCDGMSDLTVTLPTLLADGIYDRLTQQARVIIDTRRQAKEELGKRAKSAANGSVVAGSGSGAGVGAGVGVGVGVGAGAGAAFGAAAERSRAGADGAANGTDAAGAPSMGEPSADPLATIASDTRTTDQIRADLLADMLLTTSPGADPTRTDDGPGLLGKLRGKVQVVVAATTLLGIDDGPADLIGRSPVDPDTARELACVIRSPLDRLLTHPVSGIVLHVDTYTRPASMDRYLDGRDIRCRFPGCMMPAIRCEKDHNHDHALGGKTEVCNLCNFCQRHHSMKQFTPWKVRQLDGGVMEFTSPLGRVYIDEPPIPSVHFAPDVGLRRGEGDVSEDAPF
ncbi:MAG: DUF222 domain-containing protein [Microbacterium sp.]|uniref:HNH endonuclease signature motif containing protein n=1 Tax=Microbacterium sp. TaxID=51671 RepID=UPI00262B4AD3|nr:HNH endonuclease signature motif containing protein [Microbacterium sp.]MCX6501560.1 DUF222 domain-containing protein [Microbacterium sp.]